ncbi:MAG: hydantoinase/oxoprolinase N-terminal domain-containing protein, partial [Pirellulaceae bacterium]|nr:hydantoinase/oxoprolinase N-terminal domain-containing protein [Pirellulaceae bacterium]
DGAIHAVKAPSTPSDPSVGVIDAIKALARRLDLPIETVLGRTKTLIHGTTYATNLLLEGKGARVGLITTDGFRDLLELREGLKTRRYEMHTPSRPPLVPRVLRHEVAERVRWDGTNEEPLDETAVRTALEKLHDDGVEALAVCFLHAHRSPAHELRVREIAEAMDWRPFVSLSHEVLAREGVLSR